MCAAAILYFLFKDKLNGEYVSSASLRLIVSLLTMNVSNANVDGGNAGKRKKEGRREENKEEEKKAEEKNKKEKGRRKEKKQQQQEASKKKEARRRRQKEEAVKKGMERGIRNSERIRQWKKPNKEKGNTSKQKAYSSSL